MNPNRRTLKRTRRRSKALESTAYHEAGHAVACFMLGVRVHEVSIEPGAERLGHVRHQRLLNKTVEYDRSDRNRLRMERLALIALAGPEAERRFNSRGVRNYHFSFDHSAVVDVVDHFFSTPEEADAFIRFLEVSARKLIENQWERIRAVAEALVDRGRLTGEQAAQVIRDAE